MMLKTNHSMVTKDSMVEYPGIGYNQHGKEVYFFKHLNLILKKGEIYEKDEISKNLF